MTGIKMTMTQRYTHRLSRYSLALLLTIASSITQAQQLVSLDNPWVRATNAGQNISAGYMTMTSTHDVTLVKVESDVSDSVEIHSMKMENNVMKMRMLDSLPLNAGKPYKLEPGGYHLMMFNLKRPLIDAQVVNFEMTFKNNKGIEFKQKVKATVKSPDNSNQNNYGDHEHHHSH
ncbi:MAG: copper chaperone PCu(A)C [Methylotenera sp.]|jgi:copper(I)-binding protein|uniref:copper chaperone PCu(A)C n=1 Tax=Methylotenera sp. TaxID=2051956 RepID=UPI00271E7D9D|nr:copper chaperone PCu(A)C [Methylotenera sp.]MDO9151439.1 copper chaperone PCu(A)C [Methylotenera sp.]